MGKELVYFGVGVVVGVITVGAIAYVAAPGAAARATRRELERLPEPQGSVIRATLGGIIPRIVATATRDALTPRFGG